MKRAPATFSRIAREHWLFLGFLAVGAGLRVVTWLAYQPVLLNSAEYIDASRNLVPGPIHPVGYSAFIRALPLGNGLEVIPLVQHLLGLATAVLLYAVLIRLGVRRWLAALATAPVLLDAYQLSIEQYATPEALFEFLLVAGCVLVLWRRSPGNGLVAVAGLTFAAASVTRSIALFAAVPALLTVVFLRGRISAVVFAVAFAVPIVGYAAWFNNTHGRWSVTAAQGHFLYGRVAPFADCEGLSLASYERVLCPAQPVGQRLPVNELLWSPILSPFARLVPPEGMTPDDVADNFARRIIRHQPVDYLRAVGADSLRAFSPLRTTAPGEYGAPPWEFHSTYPIFFRGSVCSPEGRRELVQALPSVGRTAASERAVRCKGRRKRMNGVIRRHGDERYVNQSLVSFLRAYQRVGYVPGPLLAIGLVAGLAAALGVGRARRSGLRSAAFLFSALALIMCLGSIVATVFSWRYQLPQLVLLPPALALAATALTASPPARAPNGRRAEADHDREARAPEVRRRVSHP